MNEKRNQFVDLRPEPKRMHLLEKPTGFVSGMAMDNLGFQMRHSARLLERQLADEGTPRVIQLVLGGSDERNPHTWELFADGVKVASGSGDYARECFFESATRFMELCRDAIEHNAEDSFGEGDFRVLEAARKVAQTEARLIARAEARLIAQAETRLIAQR